MRLRWKPRTKVELKDSSDAWRFSGQPGWQILKEGKGGAPRVLAVQHLTDQREIAYLLGSDGCIEETPFLRRFKLEDSNRIAWCGQECVRTMTVVASADETIGFIRTSPGMAFAVQKDGKLSRELSALTYFKYLIQKAYDYRRWSGLVFPFESISGETQAYDTFEVQQEYYCPWHYIVPLLKEMQDALPPKLDPLSAKIRTLADLYSEFGVGRFRRWTEEERVRQRILVESLELARMTAEIENCPKLFSLLINEMFNLISPDGNLHLVEVRDREAAYVTFVMGPHEYEIDAPSLVARLARLQDWMIRDRVFGVKKTRFLKTANSVVSYDPEKYEVKFYHAQRMKYQQIFEKLGLAQMAEGQKLRIADVFCGTCIGAEVLKENYDSKVDRYWGIDPSKRTVHFAKKKRRVEPRKHDRYVVEQRPIRYLYRDDRVDNFNFGLDGLREWGDADGKYNDLAVCVSSIHHVVSKDPDGKINKAESRQWRKRLIHKMGLSLKPGGKGAVSVFMGQPDIFKPEELLKIAREVSNIEITGSEYVGPPGAQDFVVYFKKSTKTKDE